MRTHGWRRRLHSLSYHRLQLKRSLSHVCFRGEAPLIQYVPQYSQYFIVFQHQLSIDRLYSRIQDGLLESAGDA